MTEDRISRKVARYVFALFQKYAVFVMFLSCLLSTIVRLLYLVLQVQETIAVL